MKNPVIIIIIVVVIIGAGVGVYFFTQSEDTDTITNESTNSVSQTNTSAVTSTNVVSADRYDGTYFTILRPSDWIQDQVTGTLVSFHNATEVHPEGSAASTLGFHSYIAISFALTNGESLSAINTSLINEIKASVPSTEVVTTSDGTIDGLPAKFSTLTMTQQEVDVKLLLVVMVQGDNYFTFTGNTTGSYWTDYEDLFDQTSRSLIFKD